MMEFAIGVMLGAGIFLVGVEAGQSAFRAGYIMRQIQEDDNER